MKKQIVIAVDGHSACGKSTVAKELAEELDLIYIDSGAMYRAVTLFFARHEIDLANTEEVTKALDSIEIAFEKHGQNQVILLNDADVSEEIRTKEINASVSHVAKISEVRSKLVEIQRGFAEKQSIIMDGRDIGTVVFPDADVKFFLTAGIEVRTKRRYVEMQEKGIEGSMEFVRANLQERDYIDSNREDSPLMQAEDAFLIDNSELSKKQQLKLMLDIIQAETEDND